MKYYYLECDCSSADHVIRFIKDKEDLWMEVQLNQTHGLFKRIKLAFKYIFGYKSMYGNWDCTSLTTFDKDKLLKFLNGS